MKNLILLFCVIALQSCVLCFVPYYNKRNGKYLKISAEERLPTISIRPGSYYTIIKDSAGNICDFQYFFLFDDHMANIPMSLRNGCNRAYLSTSKKVEILSLDTLNDYKERELLNWFDLGYEINLEPENFWHYGNWRTNGDTVDVRTFQYREQCVREVLSKKFLIINDSTLELISSNRLNKEPYYYDKGMIFHHRNIPKGVLPSKVNHKYWD